jgi:DNA-binding MarR family transcriptional regulator
VSRTTPAELRRLLHRYGMERDRLRAALAQATGLAPTDLDALEHLEANGPQTQRALGERLLLTSGGVTVLVDRLERGGWVRRTRHPSDRRAVLVELAPDLPADRLRPLEEYHARIEVAARRLTTGEREAAGGFLARVASLAEATTTELRRASGAPGTAATPTAAP